MMTDQAARERITEIDGLMMAPVAEVEVASVFFSHRKPMVSSRWGGLIGRGDSDVLSRSGTSVRDRLAGGH